MIDVNNWVKDRPPIIYPLDADGRRVRIKQSKVSKLQIAITPCMHNHMCAGSNTESEVDMKKPKG